jgi:hypothetical protein
MSVGSYHNAPDDLTLEYKVFNVLCRYSSTLPSNSTINMAGGDHHHAPGCFTLVKNKVFIVQ